jgi:hypothetical protein
MATKEFNITGNGVQYMNDVAQASEQSAQGFKSAKAELRALQNQMLEMDQSSEEFKKASQRASELKDNISDLASELSANAGNAFEGVANNASLFGDRLMSLDLKGAGVALRGMSTAIRGISFQQIATELGGLISGIASMGKALLANPIFLIAGAVAGAIAYYDELFALVNAKEIALREADIKAREKTITQAERQLSLEKERGASVESVFKQERIILEEKISIAKQEAEINKLKGDTEAYNESIKKQEEAIYNLKVLQANITKVINDGLYQARLNTDEDFATQEKKLEATKKERDALALIIQQEKEKLSLQNAGANNQQRILGNTSLINRNQQQQYDGLVKINNEQQRGSGILKTEYMLQLEKQLEARNAEIDLLEKSIKLTSDKIDGEKNVTTTITTNGTARTKKLEEEIDLIEEMNRVLDEQERAREREIEMDLEIEYGGKVNLQRREADINSLKGYTEQKIELKKVEVNALDALDAEYAVRQAQRQRELNAKRLQMASDVFGALGKLAESFGTKSEKDAKKQFEVVKAFNLAQAIVATYTAVNNALTAGGNPAKLATGAQFVEAGIALATGLANVIKIQQTKFESKTTPSSSGGGGLNASGGSSPSPLSLSFLANQPNQQPPFQAYVISGQVSNSIEAQQLINNQSKL